MTRSAVAPGQGLEQRYALLVETLDALPDPIVITAADGTMVLRNARARRLFGAAAVPAADGVTPVVAMNLLLLGDALAKVRGEHAEAEGLARRELTLTDPDDGAELRFEIVRRELRRPEVGPGAQLVVLRDVTDLRGAARELERQVARVSRAEAAATRERDRLDLILANVADPILVTDDRSRIVLMNQQAERLFHLGRAGDPADAAAGANDARFAGFIASFLASSDDTRRARLELRRGDGRVMPAEIVAGKIVDGRGGPTVVVSVLHDLTQQVENERLYEELKRFSAELEARVRSATADLERQNARLQWQSHELEKANRLKSQFLASMSHELRTPINALLGYTALMLDRLYGELTPQQEEGLDRIRSSARHLLELINDILDLARIEAGRMPVHLERIAVAPLVDEVVRQVEPLTQQKAVAFRRSLAAEAAEMYTDPTKVKQILLNLLSNAAKFTHEGEVALAVRAEEERVAFEVRDTGIGIREQDLATIWEDFRQVDQSRTREYGGTGLGLSITRKLVERLGGEIEVRSSYGEGSTFTVWLPRESSESVVEAFRRDALTPATRPTEG